MWTSPLIPLWDEGNLKETDRLVQPVIFQIRKLRSRDRMEFSASVSKSDVCCGNKQFQNISGCKPQHLFLTALTCPWQVFWGSALHLLPPSPGPKLPEQPVLMAKAEKAPGGSHRGNHDTGSLPNSLARSNPWLHPTPRGPDMQSCMCPEGEQAGNVWGLH